MDTRKSAYEYGKGVGEAITTFCHDDQRFEELCRIRALYKATDMEIEANRGAPTSTIYGEMRKAVEASFHLKGEVVDDILVANFRKERKARKARWIWSNTTEFMKFDA